MGSSGHIVGPFQLIDTSPITPETVSQNHCNFWQVLLKIYLVKPGEGVEAESENRQDTKGHPIALAYHLKLLSLHSYHLKFIFRHNMA